MAFLGKGKKCDLLVLAKELELQVEDSNVTVFALKNIITKSASYEEEFVKTLLDTIISTRKEEEVKEAERSAAVAKKEEMEFELQKLKLEAETKTPNSEERNDRHIPVNVLSDLSKSMPKFDAKGCDIIHYLSLFEKQAKRFKIEEKNWVSSLLSLMPHDIVELIARISDEEFENYLYVKNILLKKFRLSAEGFRQKFIQHQRNPEKTWQDFVYEVTNYFQGWLDGLDIKDFNELKDLIITDQVKKRVPYEIRDHFIDSWTQIMKPLELADKIDEYESVRRTYKKRNNSNLKFGNGDHPQNIKRSSPQERKRLDSNLPTFEGNVRPKFTCYSCGAPGHLARDCPNNPRKSPTPNAESNVVVIKEIEQEPINEVVTARMSVPVSPPMTARDGIDDLKYVNIKCGGKVLKAVVDTGAQMSVLRENLIDINHGEGEGTIQIISAFGEKEVAALKIFDLKIDDGKHGNVPVTCAVSKKLVNDMLICSTAYEALIENVEMNGYRNQFLTGLNESIKKEKHEVQDANKNVPKSLQLNVKVTNDEGNGNREDFIKLQLEDENLMKTWSCAENGKTSFKISNGVLVHSECLFGKNVDDSEDKDRLNNDHTDEIRADIGDTSKFTEDLKTSAPFPDNSTFAGNETLSVQGSINTSSVFVDVIPEIVCQKLNKNGVAFSENVKSLVLKSVVEDKTTNFEETDSLYDDSSNNLSNIIFNKNIDNAQVNKVKLNVPCSETIFAKTDDDSSGNCSEAEIKSLITSIVFEEKYDDNYAMNSVEMPDLVSSSFSEKLTIDSNSCSSGLRTASKHKLLFDACNVVSSEKKNNLLCNFEEISGDEKALFETDKVLSESLSIGKNYESFSGKTSLPGEAEFIETNECANENMFLLNHEDLYKISRSRKEKDHIFVILKIEPMDIEGNTETYDSSNFERTSVEKEPIPNKRKRGRLRKSTEIQTIPNKRKHGRLRKYTEYCNPSFGFDKDEVIPKRQETTVRVYSKNVLIFPADKYITVNNSDISKKSKRLSGNTLKSVDELMRLLIKIVKKISFGISDLQGYNLKSIYRKEKNYI